MKTLTISGYIFNLVHPYVPQVLTQEWAWCFFLASREPQLIIILSILENKRIQSHTVPFSGHSWSAYFPSFSASLKLEYIEAGKNSGLCKRSLPLGINSGEFCGPCSQKSAENRSSCLLIAGRSEYRCKMHGVCYIFVTMGMRDHSMPSLHAR